MPETKTALSQQEQRTSPGADHALTKRSLEGEDEGESESDASKEAQYLNDENMAAQIALHNDFLDANNKYIRITSTLSRESRQPTDAELKMLKEVKQTRADTTREWRRMVREWTPDQRTPELPKKLRLRVETEVHVFTNEQRQIWREFLSATCRYERATAKATAKRLRGANATEEAKEVVVTRRLREAAMRNWRRIMPGGKQTGPVPASSEEDDLQRQIKLEQPGPVPASSEKDDLQRQIKLEQTRLNILVNRGCEQSTEVSRAAAEASRAADEAKNCAEQARLSARRLNQMTERLHTLIEANADADAEADADFPSHERPRTDEHTADQAQEILAARNPKSAPNAQHPNEFATAAKHLQHVWNARNQWRRGADGLVRGMGRQASRAEAAFRADLPLLHHPARPKWVLQEP
ncbi:MAG: hypothetical protein M1826_002849 [Phylliscum demangeonii]|nr:MAG: hypothetical protein M1826_002849 [Phylliscum demangeonii]